MAAGGGVGGGCGGVCVGFWIENATRVQRGPGLKARALTSTHHSSVSGKSSSICRVEMNSPTAALSASCAAAGRRRVRSFIKKLQHKISVVRGITAGDCYEQDRRERHFKQKKITFRPESQLL